MAKVKNTANGRLVPGMGTCIGLNRELLHAFDSQPLMTRIAYNHEARCWEMQPFEGEGMIIFLTETPKPTDTKLVITSVLATQTAGYAVPHA